MRKALVLLAVVAGLFLLLEGSARVYLFGLAGLSPERVNSIRALPESGYTQPSPEPRLGFELKPNLDGYFKLVPFRTNSRLFASVTGHWLVGYFAHNRGHRSWHVEGAGVQGYNIPYISLLTMGESLHNNHHAYPASARLGHKRGELDPGWWVLQTLARVGLVRNVKTPETLPARASLIALN